MLAVNVFHLRGGKILDRREFFWEELPEIAVPHEDRVEPPSAAAVDSHDDPGLRADKYQGTTSVGPSAAPNSGAFAPVKFSPGEFFSALMKQVYIDQQYVPRDILAPVDFEDRPELEELLSEKRGSKVEILVPQRGRKAIAHRSGRAERQAVI